MSATSSRTNRLGASFSVTRDHSSSRSGPPRRNGSGAARRWGRVRRTCAAKRCGTVATRSDPSTTSARCPERGDRQAHGPHLPQRVLDDAAGIAGIGHRHVLLREVARLGHRAPQPGEARIVETDEARRRGPARGDLLADDRARQVVGHGDREVDRAREEHPLDGAELDLEDDELHCAGRRHAPARARSARAPRRAGLRAPGEPWPSTGTGRTRARPSPRRPARGGGGWRRHAAPRRAPSAPGRAPAV